MQVYPGLLRLAVILVLVVATLIELPPVRAQEPDQAIEELALRTHTQNLRAYSFTAWIGGTMGDPSKAPPFTAVGEQLARWTLEGFAGDAELQATDLTRPVLLNFWASWCSPCRLEFPHLVEVALSPEAHAFDVVFVNIWDDATAALSYLESYSEDIHTVIDSNEWLAQQGGVFSIPTSLLLDTDGTVLVEHVGIVTPTVTALLDAVASQPGQGAFVAADHEVIPQAVLLPVEAETAAPIQVGESATGTLTETDFQHAYRFEGRADEPIEISLQADGSALDPYVVLMTADGERIAENDDISPGVIQDSNLIMSLPDDGVYVVVATRFLEAEGFTAGAYRLAVRQAPGEAQPEGEVVAGGSGTFAYGETVTGSLGDDQYEQRWLFEGQQGDVIALTMTRTVDEVGGLDGYLVLRGPDGAILTEVDDSSGSVMPALDAYELPADGTYTVVATRFGFANGFSVGDYSLALDRQGAISPVAAEPPAGEMAAVNWLPAGALPPGLRWITYNDPVTGTLSHTNVDDWTIFRGREGDEITVRMAGTTGELDPFLILTDMNGFELARSDDTGDAQDAEIAAFVLPTTDTYLIRATRYGFENGPSQGDYRLVIDTDAEPVGVDTLEPIAQLDYRRPVSGSMDLDQSRDRYTFGAPGGEWITISVRRTSGDLDPALALIDSDGHELAFSRGQGTDDLGEARITQVQLPAKGLYMIDVVLEDLTTAGTYELIVLPAPAGTFDPGAFVPTEGLSVELVLIWASDVDLDLDGAALPGGEKTASANDYCASATSTPVERMIWAEGSSLPPALYPVTIGYALNCAGDAGPVDFVLAVVVNGEVVDFIHGALARAGDRYTTQVEIP